MIHSVTLANFKKYRSKTILLKDGVTLLVGGNNEGKSTLLHALAVWEFCKNYILHSRDKNALCIGKRRQGVGLGISDFSPVNVPELKYLWTNLKPSSGYNLKIRCDWNTEEQQGCFLEIGLALANDRLFIKATDTNLNVNSKIPNIAYLPPFAGITDRELRYYSAEKRRLIGQGLAGAVLRNTIVEMYMQNLENRSALRGEKKKIGDRELAQHRANDPFEKLNSVIFDIFKCQLRPHIFDPTFNNYVEVEIVKGQIQNKRFAPYPDFKPRDIMVEGSGFLQWLSVYTFALDGGIDVLLLDEPDAHLHCSLQTTLMSRLMQIAEHTKKQILVATHSVEIVKSSSFECIMNVNGGKCTYLQSPSQRIKLLSGLGSEYSPLINDAQRTRRMLIVENSSDADILKIFAEILNIQWPNNLTIWPTTFKPNERGHIAQMLKDEITDFISISLADLDNDSYTSTHETLLDRGRGNDDQHPYVRYRKWRRSEIENYLLCKSAMTRMLNSEEEANEFYVDHGIVYPLDTNLFLQSEQVVSTRPIFELSGKEYIESFCRGRDFNKFDLAKSFVPEEVCADIRTILLEIVAMCNIPAAGNVPN